MVSVLTRRTIESYLSFSISLKNNSSLGECSLGLDLRPKLQHFKTYTEANCFQIQLSKDGSSEKPMKANVAKPYEKWELSQSNKEQEIVMLAGNITHLCKEDSLHRLYQEYSHA